jgi:hypothetical protein
MYLDIDGNSSNAVILSYNYDPNLQPLIAFHHKTGRLIKESLGVMASKKCSKGIIN